MNDKIYIAGPMTGYPQFNFPAFDAAANNLRDSAEVFSPADNDRALLGKPADWMPSEIHQKDNWKTWNIPDAPSLRKMLGDDLAWIAANATGIFMLRNWEKSQGARAEHALACALGIQIHYQW